MATLLAVQMPASAAGTIYVDDHTCPGVGSGASAGYNLSNDNSCHFTGTGDLPNQDPQLAPLTDIGGYSQTQLPAVTSPAIDAGRPTDIFPEDRGVAAPD